MYMSDEEICRRYRQAGKTTSQIKILSELNGCSVDEIKKILIKKGEYSEIVKTKKYSPKTENNKDQEFVKKNPVPDGIPAVVLDACSEKVIAIDGEISAIEKKVEGLLEEKGKLLADKKILSDFLVKQQ